MKDEIKEILEALKSHNDIVKEYPLTLNIEEQKLLLDYITNLQEEYEQADYDRHMNYELLVKEEIENIRLNNIIDEVRKYIDDNTILEEKINMSYLQIINMTENMFLEGLYEILDKLKELKDNQ